MCHGKLREISRNSPFSVKFHGVFRENFTEFSVARDFFNVLLSAGLSPCFRALNSASLSPAIENRQKMVPNGHSHENLWCYNYNQVIDKMVR